jgi:pimeloyl-ACP methyl ester carboxylesterase
MGLACIDSNLSKNAALENGLADTRGLIVGFEGLQPFSGNSIDSLTKEVAADTHLTQAASSGSYWAHLPLIRSAHANGRPIYIVGYSLGGVEATKLAQECRKESITVNILFLLDPGTLCAFTEKIPRNVRKVVFYQSGSCDSLLDRPLDRFLEDPSSTQIEFEDLSDLNHMSLPSGLVERIEGRILNGS